MAADIKEVSLAEDGAGSERLFFDYLAKAYIVWLNDAGENDFSALEAELSGSLGELSFSTVLKTL